MDTAGGKMSWEYFSHLQSPSSHSFLSIVQPAPGSCAAIRQEKMRAHVQVPVQVQVQLQLQVQMPFGLGGSVLKWVLATPSKSINFFI